MLYKIQNCTVVFKLLPPGGGGGGGGGGFTNEQYLTIARNGWNTEYNPGRFHGIIMRIRRAGRTVACLVFKSGRIVMTGVAHPERAAREANSAVWRLQIALDEGQLGVHDLRVVNIVGSCTMTHRLPLARMTFPEPTFRNVAYDPSIFPALRCKMNTPICSCLMYHSGKVIVTGVRTQEQLDQAFNTLLPFLSIE